MSAQRSNLCLLLATLFSPALNLAAPTAPLPVAELDTNNGSASGSGSHASSLCQATVHVSGPLRKRQSSSNSTCRQIVHKPLLYTLDPSAPDKVATGPFSDIDIQAHENVSTVEQLVVFPSVPATAKSCTIGWTQSDASTREFQVVGTGLVDINTLVGDFDAKSVADLATPAWVNDRLSGGEHMQADFTGWDDSSQGKSSHISGPVDCAAMKGLVAMKTNISPINLGEKGVGEVSMKQDDLNGWTLTYDEC